MFQSKILRHMSHDLRCQVHRVNASPYISNHTLHTDFLIPKVNEAAKLFYSKFRNSLQKHTTPHVKKLLSTSIPGNPPRKLKLKLPRDLIH